MPSRKTSTLSQLLVYYFISLIVFILIAVSIAVFAPEAYNLLSEQEMLMSVFFGGYTTLGVGLFSAYLQRSNGGSTTSVENIENATVNTDLPPKKK